MNKNYYGYGTVLFISNSAKDVINLRGVFKEYIKNKKQPIDLRKVASIISGDKQGVYYTDEAPHYPTLNTHFIDSVGKVYSKQLAGKTYHVFELYTIDFPAPDIDLLRDYIGNRNFTVLYKYQNYMTDTYINTDSNKIFIPDSFIVKIKRFNDAYQDLNYECCKTFQDAIKYIKDFEEIEINYPFVGTLEEANSYLEMKLDLEDNDSIIKIFPFKLDSHVVIE